MPPKMIYLHSLCRWVDMCMAKVGVSFVALSSCSPYLEKNFKNFSWEGFEKHKIQTDFKKSAMSRRVEGGVQVHS